jgi:hypothetical protein
MNIHSITASTGKGLYRLFALNQISYKPLRRLRRTAFPGTARHYYPRSVAEWEGRSVAVQVNVPDDQVTFSEN